MQLLHIAFFTSVRNQTPRTFLIQGCSWLVFYAISNSPLELHRRWPERGPTQVHQYGSVYVKSDVQRKSTNMAWLTSVDSQSGRPCISRIESSPVTPFVIGSGNILTPCTSYAKQDPCLRMFDVFFTSEDDSISQCSKAPCVDSESQ